MLYNWSKILNACPWARVAVMNASGEEVFVFDTKGVRKAGSGWSGNGLGGKHGWESISGVLLASERPSRDNSYEEIPDIYLANFEEE